MVHRQTATKPGWERDLEEGEEKGKRLRGQRTVLFENLLENAVQEAILNTWVALNATATFPLIPYGSPKEQLQH